MTLVWFSVKIRSDIHVYQFEICRVDFSFFLQDCQKNAIFPFRQLAEDPRILNRDRTCTICYEHYFDASGIPIIPREGADSKSAKSGKSHKSTASAKSKSVKSSKSSKSNKTKDGVILGKY